MRDHSSRYYIWLLMNGTKALDFVSNRHKEKNEECPPFDTLKKEVQQEFTEWKKELRNEILTAIAEKWGFHQLFA